MARDVCTDCEEHFPGGKGLVDGRCPSCLAAYQDRVGAPPAEPPDPYGRAPVPAPSDEEG